MNATNRPAQSTMIALRTTTSFDEIVVRMALDLIWHASADV
ncbi:MAG: hypothetical protein WCF57_11665 [Pyrinomonadaceae bacterium]